MPFKRLRFSYHAYVFNVSQLRQEVEGSKCLNLAICVVFAASPYLKILQTAENGLYSQDL